VSCNKCRSNGVRQEEVVQLHRLSFKSSQLLRPLCPVTTIWRTDSDISPVPHLSPRKSNPSKPLLTPLFFALRFLDVYVKPAIWAPSSNARSERAAADRDTRNSKMRTLVPELNVTLVCLIQRQKLYPRSTFAACCRSSS
jgi:hypothetical protein